MSDIEEQAGEDLVRRLRNWARWKAGAVGGPGSAAISSIYRGFRNDRNPDNFVPILNGEAAETDQALQVVPLRYRQAVEWYWSFEGQSLRWLARRRSVHHETYKAWVMTGHELLRSELARRSEIVRGQLQVRISLARSAVL